MFSGKINFISLIAFLLGFSICFSTALMTNSYLILVFLSFWQKDFRYKLADALKNKFVCASVIFYSIFLLAGLWSNAPIYSIGKMLVHIVFYLATPFLFIIFTRQNCAKRILQGFIAGALFTVTLSILSVMLHHPIFYGVHDYPGTVFHGHILHNAFLAIAATMCLATLLHKDTYTRLKIYAGIFYLICIFDVFFIVDGRTGALMLIIMSIFTLFCFAKKRWLIILLALLALLIPVLYKTPMAQKGIADYKADMAKYHNGDVNSSMGYRMVFHQVSEALIKQKLLFGYGTGSYTKNFSDYTNSHNINVISANPHRDILFVGVETGTLGMLAFICMLLAAIYEVIKLNKYYKVVGLSLILGYICASVENSFFMDNVTGIAFVVLLLSLLANSRSHS